MKINKLKTNDYFLSLIINHESDKFSYIKDHKEYYGT